jgi:hypothetical protein
MFLDEGGNLDFSAKGSRYFSLSCITIERPFLLHTALDGYKYDLIEFGKNIEYFHCADDNSFVRARVFQIIQQNLQAFRIDSLIVEKCKTGPALQETMKFYPKMLGYLIRYVVKGYDLNKVDEIIVITDSIPVNKRRQAIEKAVKTTLAEMLPIDTEYRILHHASKSHYGLQIADYCNWAILRKWERGDAEHYETIKPSLQSEYNIFQSGTRKYYNDGRN